ncbi:hypothetical protein ACGFWF_43820 [Streptomyces sp. NPDC048581]|uniref:hypothetical protein n=1 Tax=Streptomyces sp. NPDC048581 TaxID=3365572 RepID=UPI00370F9B0E
MDGKGARVEPVEKSAVRPPFNFEVEDTMPMSPEEAAVLAPRWRELERPQILSLRTARLLAPVRSLAPLLGDHPRWSE